MGSDTVENTALRLRAVLEILAAEDPSVTGKVSRDKVLGAALDRVPLAGREAETLASGTTRGERALVNATTKLVKAGWILKEARSGWSITSQGRQALQDFPEPAHLSAALNGKPAPAPAPVSPAEEVVEEALRDAVAVPSAPAEQHGSHPETDDYEPSFPQPESVALAGDFGAALGIEDWDPAGAQFVFDRHDELWKLTLDLPEGTYAYKVALNGSWDENYGFDAHRDGGNIETHHEGGPLTFLYDHATHNVVTKSEVRA
ncbi:MULTISPECIES: winged helix-turn-helix domain-containing protein [unclassified Arthrobacter]|uniref:pullulanase X25 domain-containing protein n=1 Tax=unclassified Arthrobacter TaxID=235627 RepID=UPI001E294B61|nr:MULTISPECIES: winged helix-turn-helix domain-containing protein [unclassified Arthrobacter]MCC9145594.1 glycosidase [Arthrobacter sp. zg-Y919]MDK1276823.1 winged helix-turn-helix domain-containing protein [Arthrobacter sp. zg.Y919]WIB04239.1 winged helix-turn-helix domain-containing protein [Arthrobacter sp. zg-Y919]